MIYYNVDNTYQKSLLTGHIFIMTKYFIYSEIMYYLLSIVLNFHYTVNIKYSYQYSNTVSKPFNISNITK